MTALPSGLSTRRISASSRSGCSRKKKVLAEMTDVNVSSAQGSSDASASLSSSRPSARACGFRAALRFSISGLWSRPEAELPFASRRSSSRPPPQPTSRQRSSGVGSKRARIRSKTSSCPFGAPRVPPYALRANHPDGRRALRSTTRSATRPLNRMREAVHHGRSEGLDRADSACQPIDVRIPSVVRRLRVLPHVRRSRLVLQPPRRGFPSVPSVPRFRAPVGVGLGLRHEHQTTEGGAP